jgi:hypothetical protein
MLKELRTGPRDLKTGRQCQNDTRAIFYIDVIGIAAHIGPFLKRLFFYIMKDIKQFTHVSIYILYIMRYANQQCTIF